MTALSARPLSPKLYAPYGSVIEASDAKRFVSANMGSAKRYDFLAELENLRPQARANLCVFRCSPHKGKTYEAKILERHAFSTQVFLPLSGAGPLLALVALGGDAPDLSTLAAFLVDGSRGISYRPGVWHHPIVALDTESDLACLVWEDRTPGDCEVVSLPKPVSVALR